MFLLHIIASAAIAAASGDIAGTVNDSTSGQPIPSAEVSVTAPGTSTIISNTSTDAFGRFIVHNLPAGPYDVSVHFIGFGASTGHVTVPAGGTARLTFRLVPATVQLQSVQVVASTPVAVDTRTGDQTFKQDDYHGAPQTTTSQILQQSIASSVRAPTGEVHIRGQHAEYTYYVDGVPVPSGVSGSLNELFDPQVVQRINFQTGGWDAEYGEKNIAVVNIQTRIPSGGFHANLSGYGGSFNTNGQTVSASDNVGNLGLYFSGTRQESAMRREPVVAQPDKSPVNFHNHGDDEFSFGKLQYIASRNDIVTLEANGSRTRFAVPYDSSGGTVLDDHQRDFNSFVNLGFRHRFGSAEVSDESAPDELFVGLFYRHGSLAYVPGTHDQPSLTYGTDTTTKYNVSEDRAFNTTGVKADFAFRVPTIPAVQFKIGTLLSRTTGNENFQLLDTAGVSRIQSLSNLNGYDFAAYAEDAFPFGADKFELRTGVRFNSHVAPFAGNQTQWSPRVKLSFYPDPSNTLYAYFGRLFVPTNIEDLRSITSAAQQGQATVPTLPERDAYYEAGYIHRFPFGVVTSVKGFYKTSHPGIDDNTVPGSAITTSVNLHDVKITGIETVLEVRPAGPLSGYLNASIIHAYGDPPVYGGFFFLGQPNNNFFDLDHDQRLSMVGGLTYTIHRLYLSATGIYGSGLTNGITPDSTIHSGPIAISRYCTGLFCFNAPFKVEPSYVQNIGLGYSFLAGATTVRPELYMDNVFDRRYLLKGAFFSGTSVGRPRTFTIRLNVGV